MNAIPSLIIKRFLADTPQFFKVLRNIALVCGIITGIPELLEQSGLALPGSLEPFASKTVAVAATLSALIAQLTVNNPDDLISKQNPDEKTI